jgi:hypothetical protein
MVPGFDYSASAELYFGSPARGRKMTYRRFDSAADAIRFAIEELDTATLSFATLEVDEERYERHAIRRLYDHPDYPRIHHKADA